ncbi:hypothetical protein NDU88_000888 [Pleurodeles waltl]|uniref:Uncharacterized protein n=1 Tax=Pleurodeles waltl TaxID=8319 RepID=A0AAV7S5T8_PLEWA|nr:hypothetical protein NDU88_000888 [Pleurodeles waltl]
MERPGLLFTQPIPSLGKSRPSPEMSEYLAAYWDLAATCSMPPRAFISGSEQLCAKATVGTLLLPLAAAARDAAASNMRSGRIV